VPKTLSRHLISSFASSRRPQPQPESRPASSLAVGLRLAYL